MTGVQTCALPISRYQRYQYDQNLDKGVLLKSMVCTIVCVATVAVWIGQMKDTDAAVGFLERYGITLVGTIAIYIGCCFGLFEYCGPLPRAFFGVAGALAAALATQHISAQILPVFLSLGIPWLLGFVVFLGAASSFLELELQEAGLFAVFTLGLRVILKFTLFEQMFGS